MKLNLEDINKAFESKARLGIMSVLLVNESIDFVSLKNLLELTDGNLASHTRNLEELGYIRSYKQFIGQAESDFRITQIAGIGKRIIRRTDQSDAIEYQHDRRSKAIMALPDQ